MKPRAAGGWGPPAGASAYADPTELDPIAAEKQRILNMPPPADLEDLFLSQREGGHDISLYASPGSVVGGAQAGVGEQCSQLRQRHAICAGGMALVGEMGPELVTCRAARR